MGTAGTMARAQEAVNKAGTLAEAQAILDQLKQQEEEVSDVFFTQEFTIQALTDLLFKQDQEKAQPVYISPQAPQPKPTNYILYIGGFLLFLFLSGKIKGFKL